MKGLDERTRRIRETAIALDKARLISEQIARADEKIEAAKRREASAINERMDATHELRCAEIERGRLPTKTPDIDAAWDAFDEACS